MPPLFNTMLQAFLFITVGFIGGALIALWWAGRGEGDKDGEGSKRRKGYREVARLYRGVKTNSLAVEIEGEFHTRPEDRFYRKETELAREWLAWMGAPPSVPQSAGERIPTKPPIINLPPPPAVPAAPLPKAELEAMLAEKAKPQERQKTMVEEIDDVLQEIVSRLPPDAPHPKLTEDPKRGVIVWIGSAQYEGIEGVPDPHIKTLLRAAVTEWEKRQERSRRG